MARANTHTSGLECSLWVQIQILERLKAPFRVLLLLPYHPPPLIRSPKYEDIYCNDREKVREVTRALLSRFQQFLDKKTTLHRTPNPRAATVNNNANFVNV